MKRFDRAQFTGSGYKPYYDFWRQLARKGSDAFTFAQRTLVADGRDQKQGCFFFTIDEAGTRLINSLVGSNDSGVFVVMTTVLSVLLQKYTGQRHITVHTPLFKRANGDSDAGVQTVPLVIGSDPHTTLRKLLQDTKQTIADTYRYQNFPLELLDEKEARGLGSNVFVSFSNLHDVTDSSRTYDFNLQITKANDSIGCEVVYNPDWFEHDFIERMASHFNQTLAGFANLESLVNEIGMLPEQELDILINGLNQVPGYPEKGSSVAGLFEQAVLNNPGAVAVSYKGEKLTYHQLNEAANQLAAQIRREYGIVANQMVGILLPRCPEMIIALMGIIKAGAAFLPIDPNYPADRVDYILQNSSCTLLITDSAAQHKYLRTYQGHTLNLDDWAIRAGRFEIKTHEPEPTDLAYMIYTSGSTGKPKGVQIEARNFLHYLRWANHYYFDWQPGIHFPFFTSLSFDLTLTCIFTTLLRGDSLFVYPDEMPVADILADVFDPATPINAVKLTPSHISMLGYLPLQSTNIDHVITGGENLTAVQVDCLQRLNPGIHLYNEYGPTETTVGCTIKKVTDSRAITIGKPISDTQIYILDQDDDLAPLGTKGEIVIGGAGVARGYRGRAELNAQKFLPGLRNYATGRLYRTGDIGRWLPDGELECLGRNDGQVKIRGYRIELSEIENSLLSHLPVSEAVVTVLPDNGTGTKQLAAYYVATGELRTDEVKAFLAARLPAYMIPSYLIQVPAFELNPNGKIDRHKLPDPAQLQESANFTHPENTLEEKIHQVWCRVLGVEAISTTDDFLAIGGDSIRAVQVSALLYQEKLHIDIADLLQYPTIRELATRVTAIQTPARQGAVAGEVPLTPIQHTFFETNRKYPQQFNFALLFKTDDRFDEDMIRAVFQTILAHHDVLRMTFDEVDGKVRQFNHDASQKLYLDRIDLRSSTDYQQALKTQAEKLQASFSLQTGPLLKLALFQGPASDRLLVLVHHLVMDVVSWRILFEDINTLYEQYKENAELKLPLKTGSFKDWAQSLAYHANEPAFIQTEAPYWLNTVSQPHDLIKPDFDVPDTVNSDSRKIAFELDTEQTRHLLVNVSKYYQAGMNSVLLASVAQAVNRVFGTENLLVDVEGHGRQPITEVTVTRTVGYFTTTYPVLISANGQADTLELLLATHQYLSQVPNQGIGFGLLKYLSGYEAIREASVMPQLCVNYFGQFDQDIARLSIPLADESTGHTQHPDDFRHPYLFYITAYVESGKLVTRIEYSQCQFKAETVQSLANAFKRALIDVAELASLTPEHV
ncbi:non-ribosomal peptide synthetase [Spirosoma utsteinense]|uniref:Non-ribosomal peptide synthase protein (TIGR01720 family) n=1 Tax=Spirosoma utsteinense TaxID=2585773 RepID=A0ABR6W8E4_9BACT|nr:non-ribosomal peptide synthetase [Spirosoma utsteinense]MBC3787165.1 non-ribosomal peptide synthase protein (TIGR01720 family) [Spirosoma utsteinense]MBC3792848.1 non-ribosomal peptide synthase protein (TIGR01720 family) [Spirosoma utsteinense]